MKESIEERVYLINEGVRGINWAGEPGVLRSAENDILLQKAARWAKGERGVSLYKYLDNHLKKYKAIRFDTVEPNLDIRHQTNFTGPRRGKNRTFDLKPWGEFKTLMEGVCV